MEEKMEQIFEKLQPFLDKEMAINTAMTLLHWDMETLAPPESTEYTAKAIGILSDEYFKTIMNENVKKLLNKLESKKEQELLSDAQKAIVVQLRKKYTELEVIPAKEYKAYTELTTKASSIWAKARENKNYKEFMPTLEEIIQYKKKFANYQAKGKKEIYNVLLEDFEPGFYMEQLDEFFTMIREELVPFIQVVLEKCQTVHKEYNTKKYEIEKQRKFCEYLSSYVGFDKNRGVLSESAHPFTTNLHNHDVRITNHFDENNLEAAIFSIIHESGHGIYEQNIANDLTQTLVGVGTSMGMHESQSRFFENIIGKSEAFWKPLYPKLVEMYQEQLSDVSLEQFICGINKAQAGAIRIEADELTYPLHILIRYEIEKMIFSEQVTMEDLPKVWNEKYEQYLGVTPSDDAEGILQDVHWSGGDFGYFPSYAIGSAVAAQIYTHMKKIMPFEDYLKEGTITPIRDYLRDHIHQYGKTKNTNELLLEMTGEEFQPSYYISYLKEKYTDLYLQ